MQESHDQEQRQTEATTDPQYHIANIRNMLREAQSHARGDVEQVDDPKARALFETTAEVLGGLIKAYDDYELGARAWR